MYLIITNSLKQFFLIFLSSLLLFPSFGDIFLFAKFKINQNEIAKTICIQKRIKNNHCKGHCQLRKSLKKFEENERKMDHLLKNKLELIYIKTEINQDLNLICCPISNDSFVFNLSKKPISVSNFNFRPPSYFI